MTRSPVRIASSRTISKPVPIPSDVFRVPESASSADAKYAHDIKALTDHIRALHWKAYREGTVAGIAYNQLLLMFWSAASQMISNIAYAKSSEIHLDTQRRWKSKMFAWFCVSIVQFTASTGIEAMAGLASAALNRHLYARPGAQAVQTRSLKLLDALEMAGIDTSNRPAAHQLANLVVDDLEASKQQAIYHGVENDIIHEFDTVIAATKTILNEDATRSQTRGGAHGTHRGTPTRRPPTTMRSAIRDIQSAQHFLMARMRVRSSGAQR